MNAPFDLASAAERFESAIAAAGRIVVSTHLRPDGDAIGSETGLVHYLVHRGKHVRVINNDPTSDLLQFIAPETVPIEVYQEAEHDAVYEDADLVLLVDNSAPDRLGRLETVIRRHAPKVLCIDHHPAREAPWERVLLDTTASATTVMIYRLVRHAGWIPDAHAAQAMFAGLATDTGFFRFNSTNPESHRVAAELLELGVRPAEVFRAVHERNSVAFTRLLGHALVDLRMDLDGKIASVRLSRTTIDALHAAGEDTSEIMTALLALDGVAVVALFRELEDGQIKVSLRSKDQLDVHRLASEYGGGGHRNASGIVMPGALADVSAQLIERLERGVREGR